MRKFSAILIILGILLGSCTPQIIESSTQLSNADSLTTEVPVKIDMPVNATIDEKVIFLITSMTLDEKIGQMTQVARDSIEPGDITKYFIGSILSGGGGSPVDNSIEGWVAMTSGFQEEALATRLGIPLIYGADATHGHGNLYGATIFPQAVGLGATNDPELMVRIGKATAEEMLATGVTWNFAPLVSVPQDIRWGRTYESFSENTERVTQLSSAFIAGLQNQPSGFNSDADDSIFVLATPKHYIADGGTLFGTSTQYIMEEYLLDQGDTQMDEAELRRLFLPPYQAAIEEGAQSIMVSFSSWQGTKMHAQAYLITDVLKTELGFNGFVVSDWGGIDQIDPGDYYQSVVQSINAGVDMNMVPYDYVRFITVMKDAVNNEDISEERINDAVRRILTVKYKLGLFSQPYPGESLVTTVRSEEHLNLAREAVRKSLVLLVNDNETLPLAKEVSTLLVAGKAADDIGMLCGGWTMEWQGISGAITPGTSILEGIRQTVSADTQVIFDLAADFDVTAEVGIVVIGEMPYAEGVGDTADLTLPAEDIEAIQKTREKVDKLVVILVSGRPMVIMDQLSLADAWVAAWLPGTEGAGVSDVIFGDYQFTGTLPYTWPKNNDQLPINDNQLAGVNDGNDALFSFGYGLRMECELEKQCQYD